MFAELKNEAALVFTLRNEGPLLINSGEAAKIHPRPDMSFVRTLHDGVETVYLPGSSIKGVFRSRYEQVMRMLGQNVCDTFDKKGNKKLKTCHNNIDAAEKDRRSAAKRNGDEYKPLSGTDIYNNHCCEACRLFGNLSLGGRISFADAYPVGAWKVGMRHGVGIDRITGAAFPGALYDIETLEKGTFAVICKMVNFKPYQLRTILWIIQDINDGMVTFGMGGSRGNGQMRLDGDVELTYRKYPGKECFFDTTLLGGTETDLLFGTEIKKSWSPTEISEALNISTRDKLIQEIAREAVK